MKKLTFALFLGIALLMMVPNASAQSCAPAGEGGMAGPTVEWYNYTENGIPDGTTDCWNPMNAIPGLMVCGFFGESSSALEFNYGGEISQQYIIPTTSPHTSFTYYGFSYFLDFENPAHEYPWDLQLNIQVWDQTTGRVLMSDHYDASQPDVACGRRDLTGFNGNLAGHTILVRIMGNRGSSSSHIRVRLITFSGQ